MKDYIFVEEKTKKIVAEKDFEGDRPGSEAKGYAKGLSKKNKKIVAYFRVGGQ